MLDPEALLEAVAEGVHGAVVRRCGRAAAPGRRARTRGSVLTMAGRRAGSPVAVKLVGVFPGNVELGLDPHPAVICLFDASTGRALALMDGEAITGLRTAAASAVSVRALAREDARVLAVVGSGVQARAHLRMLPLVRAVLRRPARRARSRRRFAARRRRRHGRGRRRRLPLHVVVLARPVVAWRRDVHVTSVGFAPPGGELDPALAASSRLFVETLQAFEAPPAGCAELAGLDPSVGTELGSVLLGQAPGRVSPDEVTVYKAMGHIAEDAAAAELVYRAALSAGVGPRRRRLTNGSIEGGEVWPRHRAPGSASVHLFAGSGPPTARSVRRGSTLSRTRWTNSTPREPAAPPPTDRLLPRCPPEPLRADRPGTCRSRRDRLAQHADRPVAARVRSFRRPSPRAGSTPATARPRSSWHRPEPGRTRTAARSRRRPRVDASRRLARRRSRGSPRWGTRRTGSRPRRSRSASRRPTARAAPRPRGGRCRADGALVLLLESRESTRGAAARPRAVPARAAREPRVLRPRPDGRLGRAGPGAAGGRDVRPAGRRRAPAPGRGAARLARRPAGPAASAARRLALRRLGRRRLDAGPARLVGARAAAQAGDAAAAAAVPARQPRRHGRRPGPSSTGAGPPPPRSRPRSEPLVFDAHRRAGMAWRGFRFSIRIFARPGATARDLEWAEISARTLGVSGSGRG